MMKLAILAATLLLHLPNVTCFSTTWKSAVSTTPRTTSTCCRLSLDEYTPGDSREVAYEDMAIGSGPTVKAGDVVTVKYTGKLLQNGKQFDAGSISFSLGARKVIPGWEEGMAGMQVGSRRTLYIPPNLAYGRSGAGGVIPPNADLEFDCEVQAISNGPIAELVAALGIGVNLRTGFLLAFVALTFYQTMGLVLK
jgi:hypothetical protein